MNMVRSLAWGGGASLLREICGCSCLRSHTKWPQRISIKNNSTNTNFIKGESWGEITIAMWGEELQFLYNNIIGNSLQLSMLQNTRVVFEQQYTCRIEVIWLSCFQHELTYMKSTSPPLSLGAIHMKHEDLD